MKLDLAPETDSPPPPSRRRRLGAPSLSAALVVAGLAAVTGARLAIADPDPRPTPRAAPPAPGTFEQELDVTSFDRGNLHAHSLVSDGDAHPLDVYAWYRDHGYQFLAITDHNTRVEPKVYAHLERPRFKILAGEEVTMKGAGREVHVNALCTRERIGGGKFATQGEALRFAVEAVEAQGGVALINHPNFDRALGAAELLAAPAAPLLEIWSGHPHVGSRGLEGRPSHEQLWSGMLDEGRRVFAAGVDDSHHLVRNVAPTKAARPGRGWVEVYSAAGAEVDASAICRSLRAGEFFASSGAGVDRLRVAQGTLSIWPSDPSALVTYLGRGGETLAAVRPGPDGASYTLRGGERWVRVRIDQDDGKQAWTQAFWASSPEDPPLEG